MTPRRRAYILAAVGAAVVVLVLVVGLTLRSSDEKVASSAHRRGTARTTTTTTSGDPTSTTSTSDPSGDTSTTTTAGGAGPSPSATTAPTTSPPTGRPVADQIKPPVPPRTPADLGSGVVITLVSAETRDVGASLPGETAGPAVISTLEIRNGTNQPFDLSSIAVTASYGDGTPAIVNRSDPAKDFSGTLAPGATARGVFIFRVSEKEADSLVLEVQSGALPNVLHFKVR